MRKISLVVFIAALVSFVAVSCKKYEEGPTFSLASKKGRAAGDWEVEKATITYSGQTEEVTEEFKDSYFDKMSLTKDGDATISSGGDTYNGTWDFDDDKENIIVNIEGDEIKFEILRLKQKELWVKWDISGNGSAIVEIHFKQ